MEIVCDYCLIFIAIVIGIQRERVKEAKQEAGKRIVNI